MTSKEETADVRCQHGTYSHKARVRVSMAVPAGLESRSKRRRDGRVDVEFELELKAGSPVLEVRVTVDNQADSHRLRLLVPGQEHEGFSVSDNQFGMIRRPVRDEAMDVWEKEGWSERPDSIYPFLSWVSGCGERGLAVLTNSVREYEMTGPDYGVLAVTLFEAWACWARKGFSEGRADLPGSRWKPRIPSFGAAIPMRSPLPPAGIIWRGPRRSTSPRSFPTTRCPTTP